MILDDVPQVHWWWCWTHSNATAIHAGCGVAGHCRLVGPYPSAMSAARWEEGPSYPDR